MKKKKAFTVIEMVIVLAITVIVLGIVLGVFMTGNRVFAQTDVKTTLQMQGKDIQERISNICMEGSSIESVTPLNEDSFGEDKDKIKAIKIKSFYKNGNSSKEYTISLNGTNIEVDGNVLFGKVKSISINDKIVQESRKEASSCDYGDFESLEFNIILTEKKGFSGEIEYPVNFIVYFRNKGKV